MMLRLLLVAACLRALEAKPATVAEHQNGGGSDSTTAGFVSVLLENANKQGVQMYQGVVALGTPPQVMKANFDVSQLISYFPSKKCDDPVCKKRSQYDSSASATYQEDGTTFELGYGQNISGILSTDALRFAGLNIQKQTFGEATSMPNKFYEAMPNDGVVALGFSGGNTTTLLDNMLAQGLIEQRLFGLWLGRAPFGGVLTLGGVDKDLYRGDMLWVNMTQPAVAWVAPADSIAFEEHPGTAACSDGCLVSMTSSTPFFTLSMETAKTINDMLGAVAAIPEVPGYSFLDCTTLQQLPTLKITIGGLTMEMSPLDYTVVSKFEEGVQTCASGFLGAPGVPNDVWVLGTLFMNKFYTAYDMDNKRLGFAESM